MFHGCLNLNSQTMPFLRHCLKNCNYRKYREVVGEIQVHETKRRGLGLKKRKFHRCVVYGNSQPYRLPSFPSNCFSFFFYLSLQRAVTVPFYQNAILEIFYLLHHLHLLLLRVYGMPTFLSTMFLSRACTKEDQPVRWPPRRLRVLCLLSPFLSSRRRYFRSSSRTSPTAPYAQHNDIAYTFTYHSFSFFFNETSTRNEVYT